jgi:hypothetical protein
MMEEFIKQKVAKNIEGAALKRKKRERFERTRSKK